MRTCIADAPSAVLAISGGLDSTVLLHAAAAGSTAAERARIVVATFDHATGPKATLAASHVSQLATSLGLVSVVGRSDSTLARSEEAWRTARWQFLRDVAARSSAVIVTAHTRDDQVETVLMRLLRGAGTRGLAALYAPSPVRRPLIGCTRAEILSYSRSHGLSWIDDPSNASTRFLRNRVRRDLLPALRAASPTLELELLAIAARAAEWRRELSLFVDRSVLWSRSGDQAHALDVSAEDLGGLSVDALAIVWPELASRVGLVLDRRGTERLAAFTIDGRVGARIQLSGGWQVMRARTRFELRDLRPEALDVESLKPKALRGRMQWQRWSFTLTDATTKGSAADPWLSMLPASRKLQVRAWQPGDTMTVRTSAGLRTRKVKHFLSKAGISGHNRTRWPVILCEDEIVWIPGVCRNDAETARSGGPVLTYVCELLDR